VLIESLAKLHHEGRLFRARIGSGGVMLHANKRRARELGLEHVIEFTGWLDEPFELMKQGDVFVLPSTQEGSGSVAVLEAMQAGASIVCSNIDGLPEDIIHEENGLLIMPGHVDSLTDALRRLISHPDLREELQMAAHRTYRERFSAEVFSKAIGQTYQELLDGSFETETPGGQ
jgi:1,4-alpha-glucan branching enzyme